MTAHPWLPDCLVLTGTGDLTQGRAWQTGMFYPQDPAARLAVLAAGLLPGIRSWTLVRRREENLLLRL